MNTPCSMLNDETQTADEMGHQVPGKKLLRSQAQVTHLAHVIQWIGDCTSMSPLIKNRWDSGWKRVSHGNLQPSNFNHLQPPTSRNLRDVRCEKPVGCQSAEPGPAGSVCSTTHGQMGGLVLTKSWQIRHWHTWFFSLKHNLNPLYISWGFMLQWSNSYHYSDIVC